MLQLPLSVSLGYIDDFKKFDDGAQYEENGFDLNEGRPLLPEPLGLVEVEPHVGVHLEAHFVQELVWLHHLRSNSNTDRVGRQKETKN